MAVRSVLLNLIANDRVSGVARNIGRELNNASRSTSKLSKAMSAMDKVGKVAGLASAAAGATALATAAAPAVAAVAALPAGMVAAKVASVTLKVGLQGVGDAMSQVAAGDAKALNEALKKLSPNAAAVVKETARLKGSWDGLQKSVQNRLFAGIAGDMRRVAGNLLPTVKTGMVGVAGALNGVGREAAKTASSPWFKGQVGKVFQGTTGIVNTLSGAVRPLIALVTRLTVAGMPLAQRMASWAANGVKAANGFVKAKQQSGALPALMQRIGDGFASAGRSVGNLVRGIANVASQSSVMGATGTSLLGTMERLTQRFVDWSRSVEGQRRSAEVFKILGDTASSAAGVLPLLLGPLGAIAKVMTSLPAPVRGVVTQLLAWSIVVNLLATRLKILTAVTLAYKAVMAGAQLVNGIRNVSAAQAAGATRATRLGAALRTQAAAAKASALAHLSSARASVASALAATRQRIAVIASAVAQRAVAVATRAWAATQWLLNAALTANPIGLVIVAIVAIVAAVVLAYKRFGWFRAGVQATWKGIQVAASFAWNNVLKPVFSAIGNFVTGRLVPTFKRWMDTNRVIWSGVRSVISTVWNSGIRPVFDRLREGVGRIKSAFSMAVDGIKVIWNRLQGIAKTPANFVIRIFNDGIRPLVNGLAGLVGIPKDKRLGKIPTFNTGGIYPGYTPGRDIGLAAVSGGEAIMRPEWTRAVGPGFVDKANAIARRGGPKGVRDWMGQMGGEGLAFARGGIVPRFAGHFAFGGIVGDFLKGVKDFTIGNIGKGAKSLLGKVLGGSVPGAGFLRDVIAGIPGWVKGAVLGWIKKATFGGGVGGPGVQRALSWARSQAGKPYIWGGVGPAGYDCSGWTSALTNVLQGRAPHSRRHTTHSFGASGPDGFIRGLRSGFMVGVTDAGVGHMAGTLGGVAVESSGSAGVRVGGGARGAGHGLFTRQYGLKFDEGGMLPRGWSTVYNGLDRPEPVFPNMAAVREAGGGKTVTIPVGPVYVAGPEDVDMLAARLDFHARTASF